MNVSSKAPFRAYKGDKPYVFVSYSHRNSAEVFTHLTSLHSKGYHIWYDEGIDPGTEWPEEIARSIEDCACFIVFISPESVVSDNVRKEINFALTRKKYTICIYISETTLPRGLEMQLGNIQAIFEYGMPKELYFEKIMDIIPKETRDLSANQNESANAYQGKKKSIFRSIFSAFRPVEVPIKESLKVLKETVVEKETTNREAIYKDIPETQQIIPKVMAEPIVENIATTQDIVPNKSNAETSSELSAEMDFKYLISNSSATITKYSGKGGFVTIPETLGGYPVTNIGKEVFRGCNNLICLSIPSSVTNISQDAIECCGRLKKIIVDENNESYSSQEGVLFNKEKTSLVKYPEDKLGGYVIPNSVTSIEVMAFSSCHGLTDLTISDSVNNICRQAFNSCYYLKGVKIGKCVSKIDEYTFKGCSGLTNIIIPENVTIIGYGAFAHCSGLISIVIPDNVREVGTYAFWGCSGLVSIEIGAGVEKINSNAFPECSSLTHIIVDENNISYSSNNNILFNKTKTILILSNACISGVYTIPNSVSIIGEDAFCNCKGLTGVTIPNSVTSILMRSFFGCDGLNVVSIPESVTNIGVAAFSHCTELTNVTIGSRVINIGTYAFSECPKMTDFYVNENSILFSSQDGVLFNENMSAVVLYPSGKYGEYIIPNGITTINENAFYGCTGLTGVTIPNGVENIGDYAFSGCSGLTAAYFLGNAPQRGTFVFKDCASNFKVYYIEGKTGFEKPWYGYQTLPFSPK